MARRNEITIFLILFITSLVLYLVNHLVLQLDIVQKPPETHAWLVHGIRNLLSYSTVLVPGLIIYKYVKTTNYLNISGRGPIGGVIRTCFSEDDFIPVSTNGVINEKLVRTPMQTALLLVFYFFGLQISFLSWGVLQEKVITQQYQNGNGEVAHFKDSQFLVFANRVLAFIMSAIVIFCTRQPRHRVPLYKYIYSSLSNIMSSWCQYEALKYISFPTQVLAKASKTIPVMIMGKLFNAKYEYYEYFGAMILSIGMMCFLLDTGEDKDHSSTALSGLILLCLYIAFDSFTSNWQGNLFRKYEMKPIQMMCFTNFFSCILTFSSLLQHQGLFESIGFMFKFPQFILDVMILSICSAAGQLFIYNTIETFGPLIFVIISTIRQCFSVLLSCIIYNHQIHVLGGVGLFLVLFSILFRMYCDYRIRSIRQKKLKENTLLKN